MQHLGDGRVSEGPEASAVQNFGNKKECGGSDEISGAASQEVGGNLGSLGI